MRNKQERLTKYVIETVDRMNINRMVSDRAGLFALVTMVGPLYVNGIYANEDGCSICMKFARPDIAYLYVGCDSMTGDWNIYAKGLTDAKIVFKSWMNKLVSLR